MSENLAETGTEEERGTEELSATATAAATYTVVANVNVRSGPSTSYAIVGRLSAGTRVTIYCQTPGQTITGPMGTSNIWDRIGSGRYISDTYVRTGSDGYVAPRC
ncbi:SH3 domain-containing protein [Streptomyces xiangluensis]|uniref:SH3 domain-containing protein n=1 Tax=Streptomyces xiangluensis TaxID=2665720 RepID=A0ABV8YYI4_9ACTN